MRMTRWMRTLRSELFFFASCFLAFAQSVPIGIDFPFEAKEKALEPGTYTFELENCRHHLDPRPRGPIHVLVAITRLALIVNHTKWKIVFDKINNEYLLSEVLIPPQGPFPCPDHFPRPRTRDPGAPKRILRS